MSLIDVRELEKTFYTGDVETRAVRGVSFTVDSGEFVALMGPSGSGKSTLLHMLGFLDLPTGGEYFFAGRAMSEYSNDELARVRNQEMGFVFQAFNLLPRQTVYENVRLPLLYSHIPMREWEERIVRMVDSVGLSHRLHHEAARLSGGEKQRTAIARALIAEPKVLFADEPTGNLDSVAGESIMEILNELHRGGKHTIIVITHDDHIAEHTERVIRLRDGEIESDKKQQKRSNSKHTVKKAAAASRSASRAAPKKRARKKATPAS